MMNLEGLEMIAVLVVVVAFVKVLEQFGLLEASYDVSDSSVPPNDTRVISEEMRAEMTLLTGS
ncbi:hypothetical protein IRJ41_007718 [Triplophysa rosa]|uniref:Uncharacterized protein n=1 Tax=Triplophysa rosa TaxID=992332 RepID=A0A9W7X5V6_TRIRA|nr:hypothetical protein IRJ41_007718 [Triplophysa rosa]